MILKNISMKRNWINHIHKRLLEMVPDIFTSLGILGTFVGLVWGLKNFEPSNYEAMTTSVASLVDGIKVAFLTSIYGISSCPLSIPME